jgi:predicted RNase H-like nuclease
MTASVVGVDGCPGGWVAVVVRAGGVADVATFATFDAVLAATAGAEAVAVDIPIGLDPWPRKADTEAKAFLGRAASAVFTTAPRAVLAETPFAAALARSRALTGAGISRQSYALRERILEVDALVDAGGRVREVHPEVSFRALAGGPLAASKRTWNGLAERLALLAGAGLAPPLDARTTLRARSDDVLDAAVAAWTAGRIARGEARPLPDPPDRDELGRAVAIWR